MITKDKYIRILKISPINYDLKSEFERQSIISAYKTVLKTCDFDFQILILSQKENIDKNIKILKEKLYSKTDFLDKEKLFSKQEEIKDIEIQIKKTNSIYLNYINFIKKVNNDENITSKSFYIIIYEERVNIKKEFNVFNFNNSKQNQEKAKRKQAQNLKKGLHNNRNGFNKFNLERHIKALNDKEKKINSTITKCGNIVSRLNKTEIYEMFVFLEERKSKF